MISNTIVSKINKLEDQVNLISLSRKNELDNLAELIVSEYDDYGEVDIIVICTKNSLRSQLGQLWIKSISQNYNLDFLSVYSGGTEVTSFDEKMVDALSEFGFTIEKLNEIKNPGYLISQSEDDKSTDVMFSKLYDDEFNPEYDFIAMIVCEEASKNCPVIEESSHRLVLPYDDVKKYNDTEQQNEKYKAKIEEIGREMMYMIKKVVELQDHL